MKRSIKHLPKRTQEELNTLLELITQNITGCCMVVLFGSYARKEYVLWDERIEFGVRTSYQSDYDIMVVVKKSNLKSVEDRIRTIVTPKYHKKYEFDRRRHASPQFIVENIGKLNKQLERGQYFFSEIIKDGINMYDTKEFEFTKPRVLSFREIKQYAQDEYDTHFPEGVNFLKFVKIAYADAMYKSGSFLLHQTCERFYNTISLVFINYRPKCHKLEELGAIVKSFSRDLVTVFPLNTDFEKRCYDLLCRAYIEARYNKNFVVTTEEMAYMIERTEILREITFSLCKEQFAYYDTLIKEESKNRNKK